MLIALSQLLEIVTPYEDFPSLRILMGGIATDPFVLLVMSFAEKGVVPFYAAMALVVWGEHRHGASKQGVGLAHGVGSCGRHRHIFALAARRKTLLA
jgi:hypothetical protein